MLNNILEVRRYEKNYFFYNDAKSLSEGIVYLERINALAGELAEDMAMLAGSRAAKKILELLYHYDQAMRVLAKGGEAGQQTLRNLGKVLTEAADDIRRQKRERAHKALKQTHIMPVAFLSIFLLLMALVIKLISQGVLRPAGHGGGGYSRVDVAISAP